ncbi:hypothetical protein JAAARDRAFT_112336, partial [Jaapia argillacea MUCL 33604]
YLEKVVKIGDVISEVHPYAKLAWQVLTSGYKVLKAQADCDQQVKKLWQEVADALDFLKQVDPVSKTQVFVTPVLLAMMKQVYECCLFLQKYGDQAYL